MLTIPSHIFLADLTTQHCKSGCCDEVRRQCPVLCTSADQVSSVIDQTVSCDPEYPQTLVVRVGESSDLAALFAEVKRRWSTMPLIVLICSTGEHDMEYDPAVFRFADDIVHCTDGREEVLRSFTRLERTVRPVPPVEHGRLFPRMHFDTLVGESDVFVRAVEKVRLFAGTGATVLITGETGTGKELFARAMHYHGVRKGHPFVPVNCGALPETLIENELFGHSKGAFTDAASAEKGLVAEADGGTLFLDEVDTLSLPAQAKLLRFLQQGEYRPLGSSKPAHADVRVVAASNADLLQLVGQKRFREDLYYRLHVLSVKIPPLRDRAADIPLLAEYFVAQYGRAQGRDTMCLSTPAMQKLLAYPWPGNIRELEGVLQRAILQSSGSLLQVQDLELAGGESGESALHPLSEAKAIAIQEFERTYLINMLAIHHGNITHAAKAAGKERRTFQRLLHKYHLDRQQFA